MLGKLALFIILLPLSIIAQPTACPDNSTGYASIAALNNDINSEAARIEAGGTPQAIYLYRLCPQTTFQISGNNTLTPLLDGSVFRCGNSGNPADNCVLAGGTNQVEIVKSVIAGYGIKDIRFQGVSFTGFTGSAISGDANSTTTLTLENVQFYVSAEKICAVKMIYFSLENYLIFLCVADLHLKYYHISNEFRQRRVCNRNVRW